MWEMYSYWSMHVNRVLDTTVSKGGEIVRFDLFSTTPYFISSNKKECKYLHCWKYLAFQKTFFITGGGGALCTREIY